MEDGSLKERLQSVIPVGDQVSAAEKRELVYDLEVAIKDQYPQVNDIKTQVHYTKYDSKEFHSQLIGEWDKYELLHIPVARIPVSRWKYRRFNVRYDILSDVLHIVEFVEKARMKNNGSIY